MNTQKGSAHVIIIVGLIMLLVGSLGFIFWQNFIKGSDKTEEKTQSITTKKAEPKETQAEEIYAGTYTTGGNFQVKIPNGWTVNAGPYDGYAGSHLVLLAGPNQLKTLKYDQNSSPMINGVAGLGWGGLTEHFYIVSQETIERDFDDTDKTTFELEDGTKGEKHTSVLSKDEQQGMSVFQKEADSYTSLTYQFTKGDVTVRAYLHYYSNTAFDVDLGEKVIRSIKF